MSSTKDGGTTVTYVYDGRGNNVSRSDGTLITYDGDNAITRARVGSGPEVTYSYDAQKRMTSRSVGGTTVHYQYEGDRLTAELDAAGAVIVTYAYDEKGRPLSQTRNDIAAPNDPSAPNKVYYYHYDNRGNVTSLTDPAGVVVKRYAYDPYGKVTEEWDHDPAKPLANPFTYSGYWQDPATKLYHLEARWYDASIGRFLSVDPDPSNDDETLDPVLNANLYLYTNNNPVTRVDPDGTGFGSFLKRVVKKVVSVAAVAAPVVAVAQSPTVRWVNTAVQWAYGNRTNIRGAITYGRRVYPYVAKRTYRVARTWWNQRAWPTISRWGASARKQVTWRNAYRAATTVVGPGKFKVGYKAGRAAVRWVVKRARRR
jgi:RHS repeat-associated protein